MELGRAAQIMDNLIAGGKAVPMIVVITNGNAEQEAAAGYSRENFNYEPAMFRQRRGDRALFTDSFRDVIKYVEDNYRVKADKSSRAIAGLSMGAMQTFAISKDYPDTFDYVGLFSGMGEISRAEDKQKMLDMQNNGVKLYLIICGKDDFLLPRVQNYMRQLDEIKFPYEWRETGGGPYVAQLARIPDRLRPEAFQVIGMFFILSLSSILTKPPTVLNVRNGKVLIVDDERQLRELLAKMVALEGFEVSQADSCRAAMSQIRRAAPDIVICDVKLPDGQRRRVRAGN